MPFVTQRLSRPLPSIAPLGPHLSFVSSPSSTRPPLTGLFCVGPSALLFVHSRHRSSVTVRSFVHTAIHLSRFVCLHRYSPALFSSPLRGSVSVHLRSSSLAVHLLRYSLFTKPNLRFSVSPMFLASRWGLWIFLHVLLCSSLFLRFEYWCLYFLFYISLHPWNWSVQYATRLTRPELLESCWFG